jgi:hypothetical protein
MGGVRWMKRVRKIVVMTGRVVMGGWRTCILADEAVMDCPATWLPCFGSALAVRMEDDPPGEVSLCEGHIERLEDDDLKVRVPCEPRRAP